MKQQWLKIILHLKAGTDSRQAARHWARNFELQFGVKRMYFARYDNRTESTIEISAQTDASHGEIESLFLMNGDFKRVEIETRGSGSLEHCHAYKLVQAMPHALPDNTGGWLKLADVLHWACNMYGFDYGREMRFYNFAAFNIANMLIVREEKALAEAKSASNARQSKRSQSARAAAGKGSGKLVTPSAG